jgi:hypothetical protein
MPGARTIRWSLLSLAAAAALLVAPAPAGAADETPPAISNAVVSPSGLPFTGGTVTITATVTDDVGVAAVHADIYGPFVASVVLLPTGPSTYSGTYGVGANGTPEPVGYQVTISAFDTTGNSAEAPAGDIQVDGEPQFDELPAVSDPFVAPRTLTSAGGPVAIAATATDNRSVNEVYATVTRAGAVPQHVTLDPISSSRFEGVFTAPPNTTAAAVQYAVAITAVDDAGQSSSVDAGTVSVTTAPALRLSAGAVAFGAVPIGKQAHRTLVLSNTGARTAQPVSGVIVPPASPFSLAGTKPIPFSLRAGQTKTFVVEFRPTALGLRSAGLAIRRTDGLQPGLAASLTGTGLPRR